MPRLMFPVINGRKICTRCNVEKPVSEFISRDGKPISWCRGCRASYVREYQKHYRKCEVKEHTCTIIREHHEEMKDDPEHLTTEFMQKMLGRKC